MTPLLIIRMTALITLQDIDLAFGHHALLDHANLSIGENERIGLIGRNGAGKSSLLKLLDGRQLPDDGTIISVDGLRVATVEQEPELEGDIVLHALMSSAERGVAREPWEIETAALQWADRLGIDAQTPVASLSGGMRKRVALAGALIQQPTLLLLDEPTNHLDLDAILWLEEFLLGWPGTLVFITHDRVFLQRLATRIIELDRGHLTDFPGDYPTYLRRKSELLEAEAKSHAEFDKKLAQEEVWIRQGIKARRTRDMGRVKRLVEMREARSERRVRSGQVSMQVQQGERSGKLVVETEHVNFSYGDQPIVDGLTTTILRGDKVGIIGPNGCGKTTLLRLMLGQLEPTSGKIKLGTNLQIAYFDQYRATLDENATVIDNVAQGSDRVTVNGRNTHVIGYLQDFLFTPDRARQPVRSLSGGERNRLLLARLFTQPANLLVLDEPTNDLDADTLDLLEELLIDYSGTVLVVSHDRAFLNNLVTSVLAFEGNGTVNEYVGGYDDWVRQRPQPPAVSSLTKLGEGKVLEAPPSAKPTNAVKGRKMSFKEQKELENLPQTIEQLETELSDLNEAMAQPGFYQQSRDDISRCESELADKQLKLESAYLRWEVLEALREASEN